MTHQWMFNSNLNNTAQDRFFYLRRFVNTTFSSVLHAYRHNYKRTANSCHWAAPTPLCRQTSNSKCIVMLIQCGAFVTHLLSSCFKSSPFMTVSDGNPLDALRSMQSTSCRYERLTESAQYVVYVAQTM
jgi:hypothetical protein